MRLLPVLAAIGLLATTPCMAQVVIGGGDNDAARHEQRADQQEHAAQHDEYRAREDAARGDYRDAHREQAEAREHQAAAEHQEHRADQDSRGGRPVDIGR